MGGLSGCQDSRARSGSLDASGTGARSDRSHAPGVPPTVINAPAIQPIDLTSLRAVVAELLPIGLPSRFEKAQQPDAHTLELGLRCLEGPLWLQLSWQAEAPRLLAIPPPRRQGEGSTLARQLQHGLRGLALVALQQPSWERVVELGFAPRPGDAVERTLVLELMGRHSNLFLLDPERRVIALGRQVRAAQSRVRPISTGDPYQPPPAPAGEPPRPTESEESWRRRLSLLPLPLGKAMLKAYQGTSPALVRQLLPQRAWAEQPVSSLSEAQWQQLWSRWQQWLDALETGRFQLSWPEPGRFCCWQAPPPIADASQGESAAMGPLEINRGLAAHYGTLLEQRHQQQRRCTLEQRLHSAIAREREQLQRQQSLLDAVPASDGLQQQADALLCLPTPERAQIDEAQSLYRRARKLRRSVAAITPRLELHRSRLIELETSLTFLEQLDPCGEVGLDELDVLEEEVLRQLLRQQPDSTSRSGSGDRRARSRPQPAAVPQPLELHSAAGLRLQVGRNHRQNEWISLRQARRGDLWFHAQELPGSHVVLKSSERPAGEADLQAAADLAAYFSRGRGNRRVPVVMLPTDTLQRIPGAVAGTVRHRGGDILWGEPERALPLLQPLPPAGGTAQPALQGADAATSARETPEGL